MNFEQTEFLGHRKISPCPFTMTAVVSNFSADQFVHIWYRGVLETDLLSDVSSLNAQFSLFRASRLLSIRRGEGWFRL